MLVRSTKLFNCIYLVLQLFQGAFELFSWQLFKYKSILNTIISFQLSIVVYLIVLYF